MRLCQSTLGPCWAVWLALWMTFPNSSHAQSAQDATEALFPGPVMISPRPTGEPERPPLVTTVEWQDLVQRLDAIEARLGQATRPPSMAYNLERRLTDLEKRIQQLEQQQTQLQKLEPRLRRLEMK